MLPRSARSDLIPLFYFHTQTGTRYTDVDGTDLAGPVDARRQAIQTCGQMMQEAPEGFWGSRPWSVTVTDAVGLVLWEISIDGQSSAATMTMD
ncbi:DUF6894 family protein [Sphingomonas xinjiangensis]|uniref:DUF6894 family protein n=1 Tax=Sphingomonas xinjiangensis TaxID=643568 RepID=UPI003CCDE51E